MYAVIVENQKTQVTETQTGTYTEMNAALWNEVEAAKRLGWMLMGVKSSEWDFTKVKTTWVNNDGQTVVIALGLLES